MRLTSGNFGIGVTNPSTKLDISGCLTIRNGNDYSAFTKNSLLLGYSNTNLYQHAVKTRHNGAIKIFNSFDFCIWGPSLY